MLFRFQDSRQQPTGDLTMVATPEHNPNPLITQPWALPSCSGYEPGAWLDANLCIAARL